ncbi:MAG TPA: hypothetical protein VGD60_16335 [Candidatus Acidoferrales bacterium]
MLKPIRTTVLVILRTVLLLVVVTAAYAAGDAWKTKPYTQWDEKDVSAVLHSSPWVKLNLPDLNSSQLSTAPLDNNGPGGASAPTGGSPSTAHGNPANATVAPTADTGDRPSAGGAAKTYNVFWWSARTIREALARQAVLKHETTPENAEKAVATVPDSYQVLVSSPDMAAIEARGEDALKDGAFLELKKAKKKIKPTIVAFQRSAGKVIGAVFIFSKKDESGAPLIEADEKQIDFNLRTAGIELRASFNPKQMADVQGPDL